MVAALAGNRVGRTEPAGAHTDGASAFRAGTLEALNREAVLESATSQEDAGSQGTEYPRSVGGDHAQRRSRHEEEPSCAQCPEGPPAPGAWAKAHAHGLGLVPEQHEAARHLEGAIGAGVDGFHGCVMRKSRTGTDSPRPAEGSKLKHALHPPQASGPVSGDVHAATATAVGLSRELSEFLVELSIGVHRYAMYPPGHPSLAPVVENIIGRLAEIFRERETLAVGVAQSQLVVEGVATDQRHPVLSDLAHRLHSHQLAAVSFDKGVRAPEVVRLLEVLSEEPDRGGTPLGLLPPEDFPTWPHTRLYPVGYDRLGIHGGDGADGQEGDRASALWLGLAQAALAREPGGLEEDTSAVAHAIASKGREAAYDQAIVDYLHKLSQELKGDRSKEAEKIRARVSSLIGSLDSETLGRLVRVAGSPAQRKRFLLDANQALAVDSVMKVLEAAAAAEEQTISSSMTRLLSKLAMHASSGGGPQQSQADTDLRENVEALIEGWDLKDPNPDAYTLVLDSMARSAPLFQLSDSGNDDITGAERLLQTALEVDVDGPLVRKALSEVVARAGPAEVLAWIEPLPPGHQLAQTIHAELTSPTRFRELMAAGKLHGDVLKQLMEEMGGAAIPPLLDVLADSDDRRVRRTVFDALAGVGPEVGAQAVDRLKDPRWFVQRNMLALLARLSDLPEGFDPAPYLAHEDERVRREAFPLGLRHPDLRDRMLAAAFKDPDERMVRMGLLEMGTEIPEAVLPVLVNRVAMSTDRSPELRALAAKALRHSDAALARRALLDMCTAGKTLLGKPRIAEPSEDVVAALHALAAAWGADEEVLPVLEQAKRSKESELRGAVLAGERERARA